MGWGEEYIVILSESNKKVVILVFVPRATHAVGRLVDNHTFRLRLHVWLTFFWHATHAS